MVLFVAIYLWLQTQGDAVERQVQLNWGMLSGNLVTFEDWQIALRSDRLLRLYSALFLHLNWSVTVWAVVIFV